MGENVVANVLSDGDAPAKVMLGVPAVQRYLGDGIKDRGDLAPVYSHTQHAASSEYSLPGNDAVWASIAASLGLAGTASSAWGFQGVQPPAKLVDSLGAPYSTGLQCTQSQVWNESDRLEHTSGGLPSLGSYYHELGNCRPCAFVH